MKRTERGFAVYAEFKDLDGVNVRIQQSSLATKHAVWIQNEIVLCGPDKEPIGNAHLDKRMARRIVKALQRFIDQ